MNIAIEDVRREIEDIHDLFVGWFNGTVARDQLHSSILPRFDDAMIFIPPEGHVANFDGLKAMFESGYGTNSDFKIQIRDVTIRRQIGTKVLMTYTEWQIGAKTSNPTNNARVTSALIDMGPPIKWLHVQETWLPEPIRAAGSFDF